MTKRTCSIDGCEFPSDARGWCKKHWAMWRRTGDPARIPTRGPNSFTSRAQTWHDWVEVSDRLCWEWTGPLTKQGYARFKVGGRHTLAHRFVYEQIVGPIPHGLVLDHLCRVRNCVRPDHLEPVTNAVNIARGLSGSAMKTHCKHGHEFSDSNTYINKSTGQRVCRRCRRDRLAAYAKTTAGRDAIIASQRKTRAKKRA